MNTKSTFKTLVFIDLETTGLVYDEPKITELAMIAVNIETLQLMKDDEELPRVLNKFVKYFDPVKTLRDTVAELTGLTSRMLMDYAPFNRETVLAMEAFLSDFQKPMCFIAHNGNLFDFPILFSEIKSALSSPSFYANPTATNNDICIAQISATNIGDTNSIISPTATDSSTQTITSHNDYNQSSLLSIACTDSLVFFREIHRLLNDKDLIQTPNENIPSINSSTTCQYQYENSVSVDSIESTSSSVISKDNHNLSIRHGYVEIPVKYIPSQDPARQQLSMKLIKIYEREFSKTTSQLKSHRAEDDCLMLLAIIKRYLPDWLEWIEQNHHSLSYFSALPFTTTKQSPPKPIVNKKPPLKF